jgi:predicted nuclease of predicted toxin-antitoxin system
MTFWLDAHLQPELAVWLGSRFKVFVKPLAEIGLRDADDDVLIVGT